MGRGGDLTPTLSRYGGLFSEGSASVDLNFCERPLAVRDIFRLSKADSLEAPATASFSLPFPFCGLLIELASSPLSMGLALLNGVKLEFAPPGLRVFWANPLLLVLGLVRWLRRLTLRLTLAPRSVRLAVVRERILLSRRCGLWCRLKALLLCNLPLGSPSGAGAADAGWTLIKSAELALLLLAPPLPP